jgi:hypothetical protein
MRLQSSVLDAMALRPADRRGPYQAAGAFKSSNSLTKDRLLKAFGSSLPLPAQTNHNCWALPGRQSRHRLPTGVSQL